MNKLLSMEVFVKVVESGSLTAAADAMTMSQPMVGKHLRGLEQMLGARLLSRTTRKQSLTEIGQQYYQRCTQILHEIRAAESLTDQLQGVPRGLLRINAPVTFGSIRLTPLLVEFMQLYPEVNVELTLSDQLVDLVQDGYDALIRIGALPDSGLVARMLAPYQMMICGAPSYLARMGVPQTPADLVQHECLDFSFWRKQRGWRLQGLEQELPDSRFKSNSGQALRMAAVMGAGLLMQPQVLLADDLAAGRLVSVLDDYAPVSRPVHLIYLPDRQRTPKLRAFIDFTMAKFAAD